MCAEQGNFQSSGGISAALTFPMHHRLDAQAKNHLRVRSQAPAADDSLHDRGVPATLSKHQGN